MDGHRVRCSAKWPHRSETKIVKYGRAWRVLDNDLEQLHRRIGQASSGFDDEEDSDEVMIRPGPRRGPRERADTELACSQSGFSGPKRRQQLGG
jgi:hypothetical protein